MQQVAVIVFLSFFVFMSSGRPAKAAYRPLSTRNISENLRASSIGNSARRELNWDKTRGLGLLQRQTWWLKSRSRGIPKHGTPNRQFS